MATIEERVDQIERTVALMQATLGAAVASDRWWDTIADVYENDPLFEEAVRLGREWRDSFRPAPGEVAPL